MKTNNKFLRSIIYIFIITLCVAGGCFFAGNNNSVFAETTDTQEYEVVLQDSNGQRLNTLTYQQSEEEVKILLTVPSKDGYIFNSWTALEAPMFGWNYNSDTRELIIEPNITGRFVFVAEFLIGYDISFNVDGGEAIEKVMYAEDSEPQQIELPDAVKQGYQFVDWSIISSPSQDYVIQNGYLIIPANSTGNVEIIANYLKIFYINFDSNGGTPLEPMTYTKSNTELSIFLRLPTKTDCLFDVWEIVENTQNPSSINNNILYIPANTEGDISLKADWIVIIYIYLEVNPYDQFGVRLPSVPDLGYDSNEFYVFLDYEYGELPELSYEGYTFGGWFLDKKCTKPVDSETIVTIDKTHNLYAKWIRPATDITNTQQVLAIAIIVLFLLLTAIAFALIYSKFFKFKKVQDDLELDTIKTAKTKKPKMDKESRKNVKSELKEIENELKKSKKNKHSETLNIQPQNIEIANAEENSENKN